MEERPPYTGIKRFDLIDAVRGVAIIGVVIFHLVWDLRLYQFTSYDPVFDPFWLGFAKVLLASFLLLAGVSLVLAHGKQTRWRAFFKRFGILAGAAIIVSIGTYLAFSEGFVYFGILHALALFSLIGVFFVRANIWLVVALAIGIIVAPHFFSSDIFNVRYLSWVGFWRVEPYTQDLVPLFPGLGIVFCGIVLMRMILGWPAGKKLLGFVSDGWWFRGLVKAGRWSLIIYMVHQPILFGVITPLASWLQPGQMSVEERAINFYGNCMAFCKNPLVEPGAEQADSAKCTSYCTCASEMMVDNNMFDVANIEDFSAQESTIYAAIPGMCRAMSE